MVKRFRFSSHVILCVFTLCMFLVPCTAQSKYPEKPITILVPLSAGGTADLFIRTIAPYMEEYLGQPLIIINRPGSGGALAISSVYGAKPDGYTMSFANLPTLVTIPQMREVTYNPEELVYVASPMIYEYILFVKDDAPWNTLEDFIAAARQAPDTLTYSTPGNGTTNHLAIEWLSKREGIQMRPVPFPGNPQSISAVLGGHVSAVNASTAAAVSSYQAGLLKPLVVLSEKRIALVPETMTLKDKGYDFYQYSNLGAVFPPNTPEEFRKKMEDAIRHAVEQKDVQEKVAKELFITIDFKDGSAYRAKCEEYRTIWGAILEDVGLQMKK